MPAGTRAMVDANIMAYYAVVVPGFTSMAISFLERVERGEIHAVTTTALVAEAIHKVMLSEAMDAHGLPAKGIVPRLKERPDLVRGVAHRCLTADMERLGVSIHAITPGALIDAEALFSQYGLLTNDSITLALMQQLGLTDIATNDDDFDAIPGLTVWKPR